jgi:tetratricopeptide (TPR) repeat protein
MAKQKVRRRQSKPRPAAKVTARPETRFLRAAIFGALLLAVTALAYVPAWNGKPIWDDDAHLIRLELRSLGGLARIWTELGATQQYYPLVHSVFWIEQRLWGDTPLPYHLVNIVLHAASALLLLRVLLILKIPGAWLAAAIFALHPVQVESVAWISELKNTLSGVFLFVALLFYLRFDRSRNRSAYVLALVAFFLGLMCKTVIAPLPAVVLVLFWWKRGRLLWKQDVLPLIPFFFLGISAGLFTAWVERTFIGAQGEAFNYGLIERCLIAGRAFWFYLTKLFWPENLIFVYPRWRIDASIWWQYLFPLAALLFFAALLLWNRRSRAPLAAFLIFAGMLFPVSGFFNVYPFIFSFVADHFQYLAAIAVITLIAAGLTLLFERLKISPTLRLIFCAMLLGVLATLTFRQARMYADAETLYRVTIERNPECWMAYSHLGRIYRLSGKLNEALPYFRKALEINPNHADTYDNLANTLGQLHRVTEALGYYDKALAIKPRSAIAQSNLGSLLLQIGRIDESLAHLEKAVEIDPRKGDAHNNLGNTLLQAGRVTEAIAHYQKAIELWRYHTDAERSTAHYNLANALSQSERLEEAIAEYQKALDLQPAYLEAHNNLARALLARGQFADAIAHYEKAVEIAPSSVLVKNNLAWQLATCPEPALRNGAKALELAANANQLSEGKDPAVLKTLAGAYAETGQFSKAIETAEDALRSAESRGNSSLAQAIRQEIELFQAGSPYHQTSK